MPYTIEESKTFEQEQATVYAAAHKAITGLEGKFETQDEATGTLEAKFHKTILNQPLGDRTRLKVVVSTDAEGKTAVNTTVYPLNAIGEKLLFGARKGVAKTVLHYFNAHLDHHLK